MNRRAKLLAEIAAVVVIGLGVLSTLMFFSVDTREEASRRHLAPLPAECEAGFLNHGTYICWFTIRGHPVWFSLSIASLVAGGAAFARIRRMKEPGNDA